MQAAVEGKENQLSRKHNARCNHAKHGNGLAQAGQLLLQGGAAFFCIAQLAGDLAKFRSVAHRRHQQPSVPLGNKCAAIKHIGPLRQGRFFVRKHQLAVFLHRKALAGKGGFIHLQSSALQQSSVRRHLVSGRQQHHIAHRQMGALQGNGLAVPHRAHGHIGVDFGQGLKRLGAAPLHHYADHHRQSNGHEHAHALQKVRLAAGNPAHNVHRQSDQPGCNKH